MFAEILEKCNIVTTPGSGFGPAGEGFVRASAFGAWVEQGCLRACLLGLLSLAARQPPQPEPAAGPHRLFTMSLITQTPPCRPPRERAGGSGEPFFRAAARRRGNAACALDPLAVLPRWLAATSACRLVT